MTQEQVQQLERWTTGIPGLDYISEGGLPLGRTTLLAGTAGSGKTVIAAQLLASAIAQGRARGVFVAFEETPRDIRRNMINFGWDIPRWEREGKWAFVNAAPTPSPEPVVAGSFDFEALVVRIRHAVERTKASVVALDAIGGVFGRFPNEGMVRGALLHVCAELRTMGVTAVVTAEREREDGNLTRYNIEPFIADNVIILRNALEGGKRRRTIELLKFRGLPHKKGEFPFTITSGEGIVVIPLSAVELAQASSNVRVSSGCPELDEMCGGGFFRDSVVLVSGATGTGKTLTATLFAAQAAANGEKCLFFSFEESPKQLHRNASGWGVDFHKLQEQGLLHVICRYPESASLEDHLVILKKEIEQFQPGRVAVDSLSALERVASRKAFREFIIGLTSFVKEGQIAGLFTSTSPMPDGGTTLTEAHISTITDAIILLRYVETPGLVRRGITVLKMRGSRHDKAVYEFHIDETGMTVGRPFDQIAGMISSGFRGRAEQHMSE
jgi:circadian clock protein KaiC